VNTAALPPCLLASLARVGVAAAEVTGPAGVRERLRLAGSGRIEAADAEALAAELDALAGMLTPGR
jgi:hypothetical protein